MILLPFMSAADLEHCLAFWRFGHNTTWSGPIVRLLDVLRRCCLQAAIHTDGQPGRSVL